MHEISKAIIKAFKNGNKLFVCGNGGSASESDHFVGEFVGRFEKDREALPAISLNSNTAILTAVANDFGYHKVFSRQLEALGKPGDILVTLSTSGTSKNITEAQIRAKELEMEVFTFPTKTELQDEYGGETLEYTTAVTQEEHLHLIHQIAREVERAMFL